ncbi:MAG: 2Fe-2S iron-sulfur cluster-binding protein [Pseudomonadota bacterium]
MAFHTLTISDVRPVAEDAVSVAFDVPEAAQDAFSYRPGQFLTLRAEVGGEDIRRSYSIASGPNAALSVGIRAVDHGRFSQFAQTLAPGAQLQVMPPEGRFQLHDEKRLLLIAAGSGITPMMAIARAALDEGAEVTLVYGNRHMGSIMFREEIDALKDAHLDRFTVIHVLSREAQDVALLNGRVDGEKVSNLAEHGLIAPERADGVFLCGPGGMIDGVEAALVASGVERGRIHHERFTADGTPPAERLAAVRPEGVEVRIVLDGAEKRFTLAPEDAGLVDAAARQGIELPYSCKGGMCCTCRCKIVSGSAELPVNYSLEPWEIEEGFTLACQARPTDTALTLDFDAA